MTARARITTLLIAAFVMGGCGGDDQPDTTVSPAPTIAADEESIDALENHLQELTGRQEAAKRAGDTETVERLEKEIRALEQAQDEVIEEEFAPDSDYQQVLDRLPLHEPPLHVAQLVEDDSHELVVRVRPRRFFCGRPPARRLAAVREYYDAARRDMEAAGVDDFVMIVDGLRESGIVKPLARAAGGNVTLTPRGRGPGPC